MDKNFFEWYVDLLKYAESMNPGDGASNVLSYGDNCWLQMFEEGLEVEDAYKNGFED